MSQIIAHTPPWVGLLFIALLYVGYLQSRERSLPRQRVALLPLGMGGLAVYGMASTFGAAPLAVVAWLAGVAAAVALNQRLRLPRGVRYVPETGRFLVPGSWIPLVLFMVTFAMRFITAVALARDPGLRGSTPFLASVALAYGLGSGLFIARALHTWNAARRSSPAIGAAAFSA